MKDMGEKNPIQIGPLYLCSFLMLMVPMARKSKLNKIIMSCKKITTIFLLEKSQMVYGQNMKTNL